MKKRVVVAMSGGVDSSVAAALMLEQGYEVIGVTMTLAPHESQAAPMGRGCCSVWDVTDAEKVAWKLNIPHYVFNLRDEFQKHVIDNFVEEYDRGRTPHPCKRCNQFIKFDHLLHKAEELGAESVITGHYARIHHDPDGTAHLLRGKDLNKDQSYVLACVSQEQLQKLRFPIGEYNKPEVRAIAERFGLNVARKKESMDLCFIPDGDTQGFLSKFINKEPGEIIDKDGTVLGTHQGIANYTIGQRKGLGVSAPKPRYVLELNVSSNQVIVGDVEQLFHQTMILNDINWINEDPDKSHLRVQYRSTSPEAEARLTKQEDGRLQVDFQEPQKALTLGQTAVIYHQDEALGCGTIDEVLD